MAIPFSKLHLIRETFGDKISEGEGCFLECLYPVVQVLVEKKKDMCRLGIKSWRQLEEMNVR